MTKADLKTGMVLVCRNGKRYRVFRGMVTKWTDRDVVVAENGDLDWDYLDVYDNDLRYIADSFDTGYAYAHDVVSVEVVTHPYALVDMKYEREDNETVYNRLTPKRYTYDELKAILGHDFELAEDAVSCG